MQNASFHGDPLNVGPAPMSEAARAMLDGIVTIDEDMRIVMINPSAQRMFGHTAAELLGRDLSVLIPVGSREAHHAHVRHFMSSDVTERPMRDRGLLVGLRANGETFPLMAAICQVDVLNELSGKRHYNAVLRDMSHEQRLTATIEHLNQRMRSLFELLPVAVWVTEGEKVVYANNVCARLFGVEQRESLIGRSIFDFLDPVVHETIRQKVTQALSHQNEVLPVQTQISRLDGSTRCVEMVLAALPDHSRTLLQMVISDITRLSQERQKLMSSRNLLRDLNASVVDAREAERRSIARELHDELGQRLTVLKLELESLKRSGEPCVPQDRMQAMLDMVDDTVAATRRIAMHLRPLMLDDLGLKAAIEWLAQDFERRAGVRVTLNLASAPDQMPQKVLITLYRIVQEALTNVVRHSGADLVEITMTHSGAAVELVVKDNGHGFTETPGQTPRGSFGLIGIHERVHMLGGQLNLENQSDGGARVAVRLPLDRTSDDANPSGDGWDSGDAA